MAGRRNQTSSMKPNNSSLMLYIPMVAVLVVLTTTLYFFGIDFGFVSFGGNPNVNVLYGGAALCILLSFLVDIMFIKSVKKFFKSKDNFITYIPFFNTMGIFDKVGQYISYGIISIIALIALVSFTPLGQFLPVDFLILNGTTLVIVLIVLIGIYSILRGYQCIKIKSKIEKFYKNKINDSYGSGGGINFVAYVIYLLPIIRAISLYTDINFINTVRLEAQDMVKREERRKK